MSTFLLSNNGKVGVYGNGDRVIGNSGTEKALIMNGATNVVVDNSVEEIHVANAMTQYTVRVDANTNQVSLLSGTDVVATFAPNAAGVKIFSSSGMSVIKFNVDPTTGEGTFTADNGGLGATPTVLPTDSATALPADAIDANQKSDNAGGPVTPEPGTTIQLVDLDDPAHTFPEAGVSYNLIGSVANLNNATYTEINGATNIIVRDDTEALVSVDASGTVSVNAAARALIADSKVSEVRVMDSLADFVFGAASLPNFGKTTKLQLTDTFPTNGKINLPTDEALTVAEVTGAQAQIDAFLARTDVVGSDGKALTMPATLTLGSYAIADTAANVTGADKAILNSDDCTGITVADNVENIKAAAIGTLSALGSKLNIAITDTFAAIGALTAKDIAMIKAADSTPEFLIEDTGALTMDYATLAKFDGNGTFVLDNGITAVTVTTDGATAADMTEDFDLTSLFSTVEGFTGKVNFTGSDKVDKLITDLNADTISMGAGNDELKVNGGTIGTIDAGAGDDVITIGTTSTAATVTDINLAEGTNTLTVTNGTVTSITGGSGVDTIDLSGLTVAANGTTVNAGAGADVITVNAGAASNGLTINLGEGDDNVTLKSAELKTSDNADKAVVISDFGTGDKISFDGAALTDFAKIAASSVSTKILDISTKFASDSEDATITSGTIVFAASSQVLFANTAEDLKKFFTNESNKADMIKCLNSGDKAILVTKADATSNKVNFWYIEGVTDATSAADDTVVLLGTVDNDTAITISQDMFATTA